MPEAVAPSPSEKTMRTLVALHDRDARSALRRVLGRSQEEDDLVQEVFVRLFIRLGQPGPVSVGAWVRGVAHNLAVDEIRRRRPVPVEESHLDATVRCGAEERVHGAELYAHVVEGARRLPDRQRAALAWALSEADGASVAGVATQLGVSVHAAESLISRARTGLRRHLATVAGDAGSCRTGIAAVVAAVGAVVARLARRWRVVALAGAVAAASVSSTVWLPGRSDASPARAATARPSHGAVAAAPPAPAPPATEPVDEDAPATPAGPAGAAAPGAEDAAAVTADLSAPGPVDSVCAAVAGVQGSLPSGALAGTVDGVCAGAAGVLDAVTGSPLLPLFPA